MAAVLDHPRDIIDLYRERGMLAYEGEGVTQLAHGWQCARLARRGRATPALVLAAWLHDLGHLVNGMDGTPTQRGIDDRHEALAERLLRPLFGPNVAAPVALHVQAKRFLVATQPRYAESLSSDSRRSLALQGGPMDADGCNAFVARPYASEALRLRVWDEQAKVAALAPESIPEALEDLGLLMARVRGEHQEF
jgi:phosphonate degradation associated HDIG domain protein